MNGPRVGFGGSVPRARWRAAVWGALGVGVAWSTGVAAGCRGGRSASAIDSPPVMLNTEPPFRYPRPLYARRVQGNVMLRIFIDTVGRVRQESTAVAQPSGFPALDSAAVAGAQELRFRPARARGEPVPVSIFFPVYFRHPAASPLPGDTGLTRGGEREWRREE